MQRFLQLSAEEASLALRPTLVKGRWKNPMISLRQQATVKKVAIQNGTVGSWTPGQGGWLEAWDTQKKHTVMRPPKGHANERREEDRVKKIQAAMATMPKKIEEHRAALIKAKPVKGLEKWLNETSAY
ncbi:hypothetical protein DYB37_002079 [Aphanomyces astaci]|nr:hypothetical protein AaE_010831 [Aphanomyces astaci]RHY02218.1 hypothetical protein DYB25_006738 [Aphanomyces astaci]RHY10896.1 hypothetical protein DYB36_013753 [Aphanomyces astaci]RHY62442.1 hypothetical protein DYB38_008656 [Aphanomyces astaci]RHY82493.1 hypothetical protein DYB35_001467 [Aphanomyces astaci]